MIDLSFVITAVENGQKRKTTLRSLIEKPTLISVFMKSGTGSCDLQAQSLKDANDELSRRGWTLIGLSKDSPGVLARYAQRLDLPFTLVSDPEHAFSQTMGAMVNKTLYGRAYVGPRRSTYAFAADGMLLGAIESVDAKRHLEQMRELLNSVS